MSWNANSFNSGAYRSRRDGVPAGQQLGAMIERACDSFRPEPDLALCLEIAEFVNSKKANTPRDAAMATIRLVNNRNQHISMLALSLLDILVKNCGYPFHLQISTKEFLNELVRRFPERPPAIAPPPMAKILQLIHEWRNTICVNSKHKEDLAHIRDMHRLLSYKGYRFPDFDKRAAAVLNPADTLKSPDELEEEDRAAQAAKLQELIRRGTPKDLAAAQELMKVMSGAEPDKRPDYEAQSQKELTMIQQRVLMLNEMLSNAKPRERFVEGDAYDQLASGCKQVQPKLQKWIAEAAESDSTQTDDLLLLNDLLNQVLERYQAFKRGDRNAVGAVDTSLIKPSGGSTGKGKGTKSAPPPNLIDFDDFSSGPEPSSTAPAAPASSSGIEALAGLSLGGPSQPQSSSNALADLDFFSSAPPTQPATPTPAPFAFGSGAISLPSRPTSSTSFNQVLNPSSSTPSPLGSQPQYSQPLPSNGSSQTPASTAISKDPFEDLLA